MLGTKILDGAFYMQSIGAKGLRSNIKRGWGEGDCSPRKHDDSATGSSNKVGTVSVRDIEEVREVLVAATRGPVSA